ncbi:MAG: shikimate kinase [Cyanobacteriota bacterium]|nr:shikimate kinase [Cyanobacteriota bacterium]
MRESRLQGLNIFLVGMMGSGKSSVGRVLAEKLGYRFFDTDVLIERIAHRPIAEIFATEGEDYFRELETKVLNQLSVETRCAIATGGGMVLKPLNWSYLHYGLIVWLDAPVELLATRLAEDTTRPLLNKSERSSQLQSLLDARRSLYRQADLQIAIAAEQTPAEICDRIIEQIPTVLKTPTPSPTSDNS